MTSTQPAASDRPMTRAPSGDLLAAIADLERRLAVTDDAELEVESMALRHAAFDQLPRRPGRPDWPPTVVDRFAGHDGLIEVDARELSADGLASAIVHHGVLLVRGLLSPSRVQQLVEDVDRSISARDAWVDGGAADAQPEWFHAFRPGPGHEEVDQVRRWVAKGGGTWLADSPRALAHLVTAYREIGLDRVLEQHLGERPVLSVKKSTLRRVPLSLTGADWHQDGSFMERGAGIRTVNVWTALTDCGVDAPGIDLLPRRCDLLETGTNGAWFDWSVGEATFESLARDTPVVRPRFAAGDALVFDEFLVHRTAIDPSMTRERHAIESWFFAPSTYPTHLVPVVF